MQHFFQVRFAPTSKDISAFFDGLRNQRRENKPRNLTRFPEPHQFTNVFLEEK